jgi:hypothetical protein
MVLLQSLESVIDVRFGKHLDSIVLSFEKIGRQLRQRRLIVDVKHLDGIFH